MASEITLLLESHRAGDASALDRLAEVLYPELKAMARRRTRGSQGLGATTLVNETFLKLLSGGELKPEDRQQFFALAATIMRQVIVDEVRYATAAKRDGREVTFTEGLGQARDETEAKAEFLLQVDEMLGILEAEDKRLVRVFECRYFAGLTTAETADALGVSGRSVERLWSSARTRIAALMEETSE